MSGEAGKVAALEKVHEVMEHIEEYAPMHGPEKCGEYDGETMLCDACRVHEMLCDALALAAQPPAQEGGAGELAELRAANVARCESFHDLTAWTPLEYGGCLAGEVGEACNLLKKMKRGDQIQIDDIAEELADSLIYLDLLAARLGIDLWAATVAKFNRWSADHERPQRLTPGLRTEAAGQPCPGCNGIGKVHDDERRETGESFPLCPVCHGQAAGPKEKP